MARLQRDFPQTAPGRTAANRSFRPPGTAFVLVSLSLLSPFLISAHLEAQEEVEPLVQGEVVAASEPLPDVTVVLHQVSSEFSGEIDSIRSDGEGRFTLRLPQLPAHGVRSDVYFASVRYRGLLYFGPAITSPAQLDSLYVIQAYDTLAVPEGGAELPLLQRSLFLDKVEGGWQATDVFQLLQEEDRTLFSPDEGVVWSYPLPPGARDFQVGQSEMAPDATRFTEGRMELYSPIPPGERFYLVRYTIPLDDFVLPLPGVTQRLEIMIREPGPEVDLAPLTPGMPVELEPGNVFRRYQGVDFQGTEIQVQVAEPTFELPAAWLAVILAGLLGGAGVYAYRMRKSRPIPEVEPQGVGSRREGPERVGPGRERPVRIGEDRDSLLVAVARLDEEFQAEEDPSPELRRRYEQRRRDLLDRLQRLS